MSLTLKDTMFTPIGLLLLLRLALNVQAQSMTTERLNQVYWNDPRVLYSSQHSGLSNVDWKSYNATASVTCGLVAANPSMCDWGAMEVCSKGDTASLIFNGQPAHILPSLHKAEGALNFSS